LGYGRQQFRTGGKNIQLAMVDLFWASERWRRLILTGGGIIFLVPCSDPSGLALYLPFMCGHGSLLISEFDHVWHCSSSDSSLCGKAIPNTLEGESIFMVNSRATEVMGTEKK